MAKGAYKSKFVTGACWIAVLAVGMIAFSYLIQESWSPIEPESGSPRISLLELPIPEFTSRYEIKSRLLSGTSESTSLRVAAVNLTKAIEQCGYDELGVFGLVSLEQAKDNDGIEGFAICTRLERFEKDGKSPSEDRFSMKFPAPRTSSIGSFLKAMFVVTPAYYRLFIFIVKKGPLQPSHSGRKMAFEEAFDLHKRGECSPHGLDILEDSAYTSGHRCIVHVYEYRKDRSGAKAEFLDEATASCKEHLQSTGIIDKIEKMFTEEE